MGTRKNAPRNKIREWVKVFTVFWGLTCFGLVNWIFWGAWFHGSKATVHINNYGEAQVEVIFFIILIPIIALGSYWLLKEMK